MAHITDQLYHQATRKFIRTEPNVIFNNTLIRDQIQAMHHDSIIEIADEIYRREKGD